VADLASRADAAGTRMVAESQLGMEWALVERAVRVALVPATSSRRAAVLAEVGIGASGLPEHR